MDDPARDPLIEAITDVLRQPVDLGPEVDARVLAELRSPPPAPWYRRLWHALREPRIVRVSPLVALGASAFAVLAMVITAGLTLEGPALAARDSGSARRITFELTAPGSRQVSVAGDFNDWDGAASPLVQTADGMWTITIPLKPGRYRYTFLVDGERWVSDPAQPPAVGDDFGAPTSVITIARR